MTEASTLHGKKKRSTGSGITNWKPLSIPEPGSKGTIERDLDLYFCNTAERKLSSHRSPPGTGKICSLEWRRVNFYCLPQIAFKEHLIHFLVPPCH